MILSKVSVISGIISVKMNFTEFFSLSSLAHLTGNGVGAFVFLSEATTMVVVFLIWKWLRVKALHTVKCSLSTTHLNYPLSEEIAPDVGTQQGASQTFLGVSGQLTGISPLVGIVWDPQRPCVFTLSCCPKARLFIPPRVPLETTASL